MTDKQDTAPEIDDATKALVERTVQRAIDQALAEPTASAAEDAYRERQAKREAWGDRRNEIELVAAEAQLKHNATAYARADECWDMRKEEHTFSQRRLAVDLERNELWKADRADTAARFDAYEKRLAQQGEALMTMAAALSKFADVAIKQAGVKS